MTTVATSTAATASGYGNQRKVDRTQTGVLWAHWWDGTSTTTTSMRFAYSTDNGATWTNSDSNAFGFTGTNASYIPNASIFIDLDDFAHVVYKDRSNGYIYYRRGTPNAGRTAWTWSNALLLASSDNPDMGYPDVVAHRQGSGWDAHIVCSLALSGVNETYYWKVAVTSGGVATSGARVGIGGNYGDSTHTFPSIDFNHTGDGKTVAGGTPHLYAVWTAGGTGGGRGIRFKKATYSGGSWTWGTERQIDFTRYIPNTASWLGCLFDGTRVILAGFLQDSGGNKDLVIYERDAADTTTTALVLLDNVATASEMVYGSWTYDGAGNVYLFGANTDEAAGICDLVYRKWTRSGASLGTEVVVDSGVGNPYVSTKRGYSNSRIEWIYTDGAASPYNVVYDSVSLNTAPNAPTLVSPVGGVSIDLAVTQRFSWTFSDPDSGDTQSKFDLRYRPAAGGTWTVVTGSTPNNYYDLPASTLTAGDYEWQVRTYDALGAVGPYSSSAFFTAAVVSNDITITAPTNGATISTETFTVTWSTPTQTHYQLRVVADLAGVPDTATVIYDTGEIASSSARSRQVSYPDNGVTRHTQVRKKQDGLWSDWASVSNPVSYTPPAVPGITVDDTSQPGAIQVQATHPTPTGSEPTVSYVDVWRRETDDTSVGIRVATELAPTGIFADWFVASGVSYAYRVQAWGDNQTSSYSEWSEDGSGVVDDMYEYGGY